MGYIFIEYEEIYWRLKYIEIIGYLVNSFEWKISVIIIGWIILKIKNWNWKRIKDIRNLKRIMIINFWWNLSSKKRENETRRRFD